MTAGATKTAPQESFDYYLGSLNVDPLEDYLGAFERQTRSYEQFPPSFNWNAGEIDSLIVVNNREFGALSASEPGHLLRAFITGQQVVSGASAASYIAGRILAVGAGSIGGNSLTLIPLDADDAPVGERIPEITRARALVESRLDALSALSAGWLDGEGLTPTRAAIGAARHLIWVLLNHGAPRPRLAPTPEGGIEAEWTEGDREVSVTFEPDGGLYGNAVDVATGEMTEPELNPADHKAVADFVLGHA